MLVADRQPVVCLRTQAERRQAFARAPGVGDAQHHVVDVVLDVGAGRLDQTHAEALRRLEGGDAALTFDRQPARQGGKRRLQVRHAQHDPLQGAGIARALGREQRQLAAARIRPHEGEGVRAIDDVHPGVLAEEVRQRVAVGDPQGDVVEGGRFHRPGVYSPLAWSPITHRALQDDRPSPPVTAPNAARACRFVRHGPPPPRNWLRHARARARGCGRGRVPELVRADASQPGRPPRGQADRELPLRPRQALHAEPARRHGGPPAVALRPCARRVVGDHALREALPPQLLAAQRGPGARLAPRRPQRGRPPRRAAPDRAAARAGPRRQPACARTADGRAGDHLGLPRVVVGRRAPDALLALLLAPRQAAPPRGRDHGPPRPHPFRAEPHGRRAADELLAHQRSLD